MFVVGLVESKAAKISIEARYAAIFSPVLVPAIVLARSLLKQELHVGVVMLNFLTASRFSRPFLIQTN